MDAVSSRSPSPIIRLGLDAVVPEGLRHGADCVVETRAVIGPNCTLGDRVHIGANATVLAPPHAGFTPSALVIRDDVTIGAAAVVCGPSVVGLAAKIEPGSVVTQDVPANAIVAGNPAQIVGYSAPPGIDGTAQSVLQVRPPDVAGAVALVGGASLIRFPEVVDIRGKLTFGEVDGLLPFKAERFFFVHDVPSVSIRGEHAHRTLHEVLVCASGSLYVSLTDGLIRCQVTLSEPCVGLYLPPLVWSAQYRFEPSTVLLVLCSAKYDPASYIRDFDEFMAESR